MFFHDYNVTNITLSQRLRALRHTTVRDISSGGKRTPLAPFRSDLYLVQRGVHSRTGQVRGQKRIHRSDLQRERENGDRGRHDSPPVHGRPAIRLPRVSVATVTPRAERVVVDGPRRRRERPGIRFGAKTRQRRAGGGPNIVSDGRGQRV